MQQKPIKNRGFEARILILAPLGRDATLTRQVLAEVGLASTICSDSEMLGYQLAQGAGAVLLTEEALSDPVRRVLEEFLQAQPAWSDLPLILLTHRSQSSPSKKSSSLHSVPELSVDSNLTVLRRPVSITALVTICQTALRARLRQYEVRDLLKQRDEQNQRLEKEVAEREQVQAELRKLNESLEQHVAKRTVSLAATNKALRKTIQERYQAEEALAEERHLLRTLIDNLFAFIYVKDTNGRYLICNSQAVHALGVQSEKEVVDKTVFDFYSRKLAARYHVDDQMVVHTGRPLIDKEELTVDKVGNQRWLSTTKVPLRDEQGRVTAIVGISQDITRRKQMEESLRESEERFRKVFEEGPLGISIVDQDLRYIRVNSKLAEMLEYSEAELIGRHPLELTHPDDIAGSKIFAERLFQGEASGYQLEKRYITKTNKVIWVSLTASVMHTERDTAIYGLAMVEDITKRKQIEAERFKLLSTLSQQHDQLRALSARLAEVQERERQRLSRELHDQVGQILTALNFNLGYVQAQIPESLPVAEVVQPRLTEAMALVTQTTERVRDVMAELRPPLLDENGLVDALEWYAHRFSRWSGLAVTLEGEAPSPRPAASVENALFRIAQEALTNIAKHAQASQVTISVEADDEIVRLTIADNGLGFSQDSPPGRTKENGWGMLTMAERAEMVDGLCRIESQPEQGTQVVVEAPRSG